MQNVAVYFFDDLCDVEYDPVSDCTHLKITNLIFNGVNGECLGRGTVEFTVNGAFQKPPDGTRIVGSVL